MRLALQDTDRGMVQQRSEDLVRVLDQDGNDEIPMESFATFARLRYESELAGPTPQCS